MLSTPHTKTGRFEALSVAARDGERADRLLAILPGVNIVPEDFVTHRMIEMLMDENSKLVDADFGGNGELQNGKVFSNLRGFKVYKSNNLPFVGTGAGATAGGATDFGVIVAGHNSAVATAQQIDKTESFRDPNTFADKVRGMQLYGRKILRPEALFTAAYSLA